MVRTISASPILTIDVTRSPTASSKVIREFRANCKATSSNQARGLSFAISAWRMSASRFQGQRHLRRAADVHFRRRFLAVSLTHWRRRVDRVSGAEATVQRFQVTTSTIRLLIVHTWDRPDHCTYQITAQITELFMDLHHLYIQIPRDDL